MTKEKLVIGLILLLNFLNVANSQDVQFSEMENLPTAKSALTSANNGTHIFVVNGFSTSALYTPDVFQYDIAEDTWSVLTSATIPKRYASCGIVGDYLYVFNGVTENGVFNNAVEKINLIDGSIQYLSDNPQPSRAAGVATWNNKIYAFGGAVSATEYSNKLYEFDPENDTWTELSEIPFAGETKGEIVDEKLYIFGGYNGTVSDRIDVYNIASNTWEANFVMPTGISAHATTVIDHKIYLVGDYSNLISMAYFDTVDNSFYTLSSNLEPRRHCAAEGIDGSLFAIGGNTTSSTISAISSVQKADVMTSIRKISNTKIMTLYPNPTTDIVNMNMEFETLLIFDLEGKMVKGLTNVRQVEVDELQSGIYFMKGYIGQNCYQAKLVKF